MFSLFLGGKLGDLLAPRPRNASEIWSYLKAGLFDKVVSELRKSPRCNFDLNIPDDVTGLAPLHFAAAAGAMELLVELLSQSADISVTDADGNSALHFASQNERKGIIEILLRCGADPSIPNEKGQLPVELSRTPDVVELFLRDRATIFSPIVQTRILQSEYISEMGGIPVPVNSPSPLPVRSPSRSSRTQPIPNSENVSSTRVAVDAVLTTPVARGQPSISLDTTHSQEVADNKHNGTESSEEGDDYTLVGIASAQKPHQIGGWSASSPLPLPIDSSAPVSPPPRVTVPKLNLYQPFPETVGPPPTEGPLPQQFLRSASSYPPLPMNVSARRDEELRSRSAGLSAAAPVCTPRDGSYEKLQPQQQQRDDELATAVLRAAVETAQSLSEGSQVYEVKKNIVYSIHQFNEEKLRKLLRHDPSLATCRITELGNLVPDGQTPLHVAAASGSVKALTILLEAGKDASCWIRDLAGRTPLHVAAENGRNEACLFLRERMAHETHIDPVGPDAPCDLSGSTPMGRATLRSRGKPSSHIQDSLFLPGDKSILPHTPHSIRAGKSPWKGSFSVGASGNLTPHIHNSSLPTQQAQTNLQQQFYSYGDKENLIYAYSEASGWTPQMEDRVLVACPVAGRPAWSMFGVCDGHGGSFCSSYLSKQLPILVAREASRRADGAGLSLGIANDSEATPENLTELLHSVCIDADRKLQEHPRMVVELTKLGNISCFDSSGSTAVMALVTSRYVAVANVGDSRCVLAQKASDALDNVNSPFRDNVPKRRNSSSCNLRAIGLSNDHKFNDPAEKARAVAAGAIVDVADPENNPEGYQVYTTKSSIKLRMSRSFGDFYLKQNSSLGAEKQAVVAVPEVIVHSRTSRDAFLVLACDGVWDVMTNQDVVDFVGNSLGFTAYGGPVGGVSTQMAAEACDLLLQEALHRGSQDNLSVVLVVLGPPLPLSNSHSTCPSARSDRPRGSFTATPVDDDVGGSESVSRNSVKGLHTSSVNADSSTSAIASTVIDASDPVSLPIYSERALQNQRYEEKDDSAPASIAHNIRKQLNFSDS